MASLLDDFAEPFVAVEAADAVGALAEHWGIEARDLARLDTERDDTFRAETATGAVVLKIAHPTDPPELIDLQSRAMEHAHAADPGIPLQSIVPTTDGGLSVLVNGRVARVLTWLDGDLMLSHPPSIGQLTSLGRMLGRLNRALAGFEHPASDRELIWDLPRLPAMRPYTDDPYLLGVIDRYADEVVPRLDALPHQIVHNDIHPGNVLVDPADRDRVVGILDFGDTLRTARACDLGVAIAYLLPDVDDIWPSVDAIVGAFEAEVPLLEEERALIPDLVSARLVMRNLIAAATGGARNSESPFFDRNLRSIHRILETR
ncbi:MAG: phosphotransferase [Pseudolysinimonas sp.]